MKTTITVEEFEILRQSVSTIIEHVEKGQLNADSLKSLHEYLQKVSVIPEFKYDTKPNFTR